MYHYGEKSVIQQSIALPKSSLMKLEHHLWVYWHLQNAANNNRKYPDITDGDMVRYKLKPSIGTKSHEPKWSSTRHKVVGNLTDSQYHIPSVAVETRKSKVWMRHELLKV